MGTPRCSAILAGSGLYPNATVEVIERFPFAGPLRIRVLGQEHIIGRELADAVHVRRQEP